jgi:ornithine cyclodeaminase/alanine dehydrogenase-like protein (mu-crystallin family)
VVLLLGSSDIKSMIGPKEAISIATEFFRTFDEGDYRIPERTVIHEEEEGYVWLFMPSSSKRHGALALKVVNEYRRNPEAGLPHAQGLTLLHDLNNGRLLCLLDSHTLTQVRTAAMTCVAAERMFSGRAEVLAVIGSGDQARINAEFLNGVLMPSTVRVYSRSKGRREAFAAELKGRLGINTHACDSPSEAVKGADAVLAATNSPTPVFDGDDLAEDVLVMSIGALPTRRELDLRTFERASFVCADRKASVLSEAGDVIEAIKRGIISEGDVAELSEIVRGLRRPVPTGIRVYKSVGFAAIDLYFSVKLYELARQRGLGRSVDL